MADIVEYYNKFNEDKRLNTRHGEVEFTTTMHYIKEYLPHPGCRVADIGAGTGKYSLSLAGEGYDVTAVELVKYNLGILKKHLKEELPPSARLTAYQGNALNLKKLPDEEFDLTLLLGPLYHLHSLEDKIKALSEAVRITKKGGIIMVAYVMADYALIKHGFMEGHILDSFKNGALSDDYNIISDEEELYDYVRLSDIDVINKAVDATRVKIISPDGASDYIRPYINEMSEEEFELFKDYQIKNSARPEIVGAGSHTVDILRKN